MRFAWFLENIYNYALTSAAAAAAAAAVAAVITKTKTTTTRICLCQIFGNHFNNIFKVNFQSNTKRYGNDGKRRNHQKFSWSMVVPYRCKSLFIFHLVLKHFSNYAINNFQISRHSYANACGTTK